MVEERYEFTPKARKSLFILIGVGIVLTVIGVIVLMTGGGHGEAEGSGGEHAFHWYKRVFSDIWINNIFFTGRSGRFIQRIIRVFLAFLLLPFLFGRRGERFNYQSDCIEKDN